MSLAGGVFIGLVFGVLAGACAFVIAYAEYRRNWSFSGSASRMALRSGLVAFLFFFLGAIAVQWVFVTFVSRR